jgi:membrane protein
MRDISPESPEARRERDEAAGTRFHRIRRHIGPGSRFREVVKRVAVGVYSDGFIHAGNLAYLALLSIFPFVIVAAAIAQLVGQSDEGMNAVNALLQTMPFGVRHVLEGPIRDVVEVRSGSLLWLGALVGLWTTGSFIETIRDILRRAYGVRYSRGFWEYRLGSMGLIIASVIVAMMAFAISVALSGAQQLIVSRIPSARELVSIVTWLRALPSLVLFGSLYVLFFALTPADYRREGCPKWPGALFVTLWWAATTALLPVVLGHLVNYGMTYGSLAGVIVALLFFFLIGLGLVIGAELNAALAESPASGQEEDEASREEGDTPPKSLQREEE